LEATILNFWSSFHKLGVYEGIENLWKLSNGQTETFKLTVVLNSNLCTKPRKNYSQMQFKQILFCHYQQALFDIGIEDRGNIVRVVRSGDKYL